MNEPLVTTTTELLAGQGDLSYREVRRVAALSLGLFTAQPGHVDTQGVHAVDEVYVVSAGRAVFEVDGQRSRIATGAVLHVPAGIEHRFLEVTEALRVVVVFAPPEG